MLFRTAFRFILVFLLASQVYWVARAYRFGQRRISNPRLRRWLYFLAALIYAAIVSLNFGPLFHFGTFAWRKSPTHLTFADAFLAAPFEWWIPTSMLAFVLAAAVWIVKGVALSAHWARRRLFRAPGEAAAEEVLASPPRRLFLERTACVVIASPFAAGAYGLLYGRLDLEVTRQPIHLARLPQAFAGFRIAQLSDIHIGPFMSEDQIRKYAALANSLKPDLIVLTGDFVTWDASTQRAVVSALAGLKAPFGVFGCLGNHERWAHVEDSITAYFAQTGVRMLRDARQPVRSGRDVLNLIGVDPGTGLRGPQEAHSGDSPFGPLTAIAGLVAPDTANILLSHYPDNFPRAAGLGIDLTLAGHTHGGQVALNFISPEIAPSRLITPYVAGWFERPGGQLYVNRGIGTIGVPIRVGAPPEITVFELKRKA